MNQEQQKLTWGKLYPRQKKKLFFWSFLVLGIAISYLLYTGISLSIDKSNSEKAWEESLKAAADPPKQYSENENSPAISVYASTYVNSIDSIDIRQSEYSISFNVLFCWNNIDHPEFDMSDNFRIYNGKITEKDKLKEYDKDGMHYQVFFVSATVKEIFSTKRFPLSSYQLRFYIQPKEDMTRIHMQTMDNGYSGSNEQLNVSGFELLRTGIADFYYEVPKPARYGVYTDENIPIVYSEILTCIELNRNSWGVYFKCTIALLGCTIWAFLSLFACLYYNAAAMKMLPPVLFGVVSNIMVGASLVPDTLETGLLEYINIWGIYTIIMITMVVVQVIYIRTEQKDEPYALLFGKILLIELLITITAGFIVLPLCAYRW